MTIAKRALLGLAVLVAGFVAVWWWALESGGVAIIETRDPDGAIRSTHVWYVQPDGELWVEAGAPENGWFRDVQADPVLAFRVGDDVAHYVARPLREAAARQRLRKLLREKYGLRDRWVGLFVDSSRSVAVQLSPAFQSVPTRLKNTP